MTKYTCKIGMITRFPGRALFWVAFYIVVVLCPYIFRFFRVVGGCIKSRTLRHWWIKKVIGCRITRFIQYEHVFSFKKRGKWFHVCNDINKIWYEGGNCLKIWISSSTLVIVESTSLRTSARFLSMWQNSVLELEPFLVLWNWSYNCNIREILLFLKNSSN